MNKTQAKGLTSKRRKPVIVPVEDDPENQWISKQDFLKKRAAQKAAVAAGEEAKRRVLAEAGVAKPEQKLASVPKVPSKIEKLRKELQNAEKSLSEKPGSKVWAKKVKEISEELEVAESESQD